MLSEKRRYQAIFFVYFAASNGLFSFRNVFFKEVGLTGLQMGVVGALMVLAGMVAQPSWGLLADRSGRAKAIITLGTVGSVLLALLFPFVATIATPFVLFVVIGMIYSVFSAPISPITNSMVLQSDVDFGGVRAFGSIAFGLGVLALGFLIAAFGISVIFYLYAVGMVVFLALLYGLSTPDVDTTPDIRRESISLVTDRRFVLLLVVIVLFTVMINGGAAYFAVYMREIGAGDTFTGIAWLLQTIAEAVVFLGIGHVSLRLRDQLSLGIGCVIVAHLVLGSIQILPAIIVVQIAHGAGYALVLLASVNMAYRFAPAGLASTGQTVLTGLGMGIGSAIGQLVAGQLYDLVGVQALYLYLAVGGALALVVSFGFFLPGFTSTNDDSTTAQ